MRLFGTRCIGIYTVGYIYEIDLAYNSFMNEGLSGDFIISLSSAIGVNPYDNYIHNITKGSTIVTGVVSAASPANAQLIMSSIQSSTATGFPKLSSHASIY